MLTLPQPMFILKRGKNDMTMERKMCLPSLFQCVLKLKATNNEEKAENEICFSHLSVYAIAFIRTTELQASLSMGERKKMSQINVYLVHEPVEWDGKKQRAQKHKQSRCSNAPRKKKTFKRRTKHKRNAQSMFHHFGFVRLFISSPVQSSPSYFFPALVLLSLLLLFCLLCHCSNEKTLNYPENHSNKWRQQQR